ncbi:CPBP family glutamic-type intramembrane protease [Sphingobacterium oryzagri]|uniref:CPBP family glutamic-type intramembrane protease n=1 Tax=Sphingobacterium oryzagri TaxID=3025669 RepID=A0ABY7WDM4_9SPHI|nr:CPBP family glutamic-type intramembrane protease [Sphingobacterium sp. KACC 22765]WDF67607.1 CPBP family glutamic-type intramembrane protease [Sphingobacterium sp. KACC 22765]
MNLLKDFAFFLWFSPERVHERTTSLWYRFGVILRLLLVLLLVKLLWSFCTLLLQRYQLIDVVDTAGGLQELVKDVSLTAFFAQVALFGPVFEELTFRGILQRGKFVFAISLVVFLYLLVSRVLAVDFYALSLTTGVIFFCSAASVLLIASGRFLDKVHQFALRHSRILLWLSAVGFSLWHYPNFQWESASLLSKLIYLFPFFFSALIFSWVSFRFGLRTAILLHILNNSLPAIFMLVVHAR